MCKSKIPVILIFGATACGKTDFAVSVFGNISKTGLAGTCEIVSADSVQVYKEAVIASALPTKNQCELLPHHLVACIDGSEEFSVSDFVHHTDKVVKGIYTRNKIPVLLGGAAFFLKNFLYDLPSTPKANMNLRRKLQNELKEIGEAEMFRRLQACDSVTAQRVNPKDHYRVLRALEVYEASGKPLSSFKLSNSFRSQYNFLILTLTRSRENIYKRINRRVDDMFEAGLEAEFKSLLKKGYTAKSPIMKAIGYSEFFVVSPKNPANAETETVKALIKRDTRRYAKRQETFFKSIKQSKIVNLEQPAEVAVAIEKIKNFVKNNLP